MSTNVPSPPSLAVARVIHGALVLSVVVGAGGVAFMVTRPAFVPTAPDMALLFVLMIGVVAAAAIVAPVFLWRGQVRQAGIRAAQLKHDSDRRDLVIGAWFATSIMQGALAESFGLLALVAAFLTGYWYFLGGAGLSLALLLAGMPSVERAGRFWREATGTEPPADL